MRTFILAAWLVLALAGATATCAQPPPLEAYGQLPTLENVTLSPSGRRIAFVLRDAQGAKVVAREIDGPILMAAPVNAGLVDKVGWAGEDIIVVAVSNTIRQGGYARIAGGAFALDIAKKTSVQIFQNLSESVPEVWGFYGVRQVASKWYGYFAALSCPAHTPCAPSLYRVDLETGAPVLLDRASAATQWLLDDDGAVAARLIYNPRTSHWALDSLKLGGEVAQGAAGFDGVSIWGLGRTPDTALVHTRGEDGFYTFFEAPLSAGGGAPKAMTAGREVSGQWTDPDTGRLVGYAWYDDDWHNVLFDPQAQKRADAAAAAFPGYRVKLVSASRDFGRIVAYTDGGDDPGSYWLVDIAGGKASVLGPAHPLVPTAQTAAISIFRYKAADGLPLEAVLTLPPGREPKGLPLVVIAHGGPGDRALPEFDWMAQAFASRGYAVLAPNFRGSGGFGKAFRDAGFNEWGRKMQTDLSDGVDALAATGVVDAARACVIGVDYGAYAALAGVTLQHGRYRCALGFEGVYDLGGVLAEKSDPFDQVSTNYWRTFIGVTAQGTNPDRLSPLKRAADADAPIMLVDTKANWTMVIVQSPQMERALRQAGKPVERVALDGDDWRLREPATRLGLLRAAVPFIERNNPSGAP